jgi:hypothetical protein
MQVNRSKRACKEDFFMLMLVNLNIFWISKRSYSTLTFLLSNFFFCQTIWLKSK